MTQTIRIGGRGAGKRLAAAQAAVADWNKRYPVGTAVSLLRDSGATEETRTRSQAEVCSAGYAVIWLEGVRGYFLLERVAPREAARCICADGGPGSYEGPMRDCPVHGEQR